jgi:hypothetical protein
MFSLKVSSYVFDGLSLALSQSLSSGVVNQMTHSPFFYLIFFNNG